MANMALDTFGNPIFASNFSEAQWELYKTTAPSLTLPCCGSKAILKTSSNGMPFYAHLNDECATSPESIWHLNAKEALAQGIKSLGIEARLEVPGGEPPNKWIADIFFEYNRGRYAIEIQHSYQHLRDYQARQKRYQESGVNSFWVLYLQRYLTISKSITKHRLRNEFNNKFPTDLEIGSGLNQLSSLPLVWLDPENDEPIRSPGGFSASIPTWILAILDGSFCYATNGWKIR